MEEIVLKIVFCEMDGIAGRRWVGSFVWILGSGRYGGDSAEGMSRTRRMVWRGWVL